MKNSWYLIAVALVFVGAVSQARVGGKDMVDAGASDSTPTHLKGRFKDDYGITYTINDTLWTQGKSSKYHILRWNIANQYLVAKNDTANPSDKGLYTRIDYMDFTGMEPFKWGFCLTAYDALSDSAAEATAAADRKNPRKGCNGYPFSRMKPVE